MQFGFPKSKRKSRAKKSFSEFRSGAVSASTASLTVKREGSKAGATLKAAAAKSKNGKNQTPLQKNRADISTTKIRWAFFTQVMAVETGILSFEAVFMPFMLLPDGQTVIERASATGLLPAPDPS